MFTPSRLTLARKRRGLTKVRLAREVHVTSRCVMFWENGETTPSPETVERLATVLGFPVDFFSGPDIAEPNPDGASFRALTAMTATQRDAALAAGALALELSKWIEERFELPAPSIPEMGALDDPETAAEALRAEWGLGEQPIKNMIHLLELHGVRVFSLTEECKEVDAFSLWRDGLPFVFLNTVKSAERSRHDAAHELGHLVLHRKGGPTGRDAEREANQFASAFLMPKASVLARASAFATLPRLISLKKTWNVSVASLAYRLHQIGVLSEWHYRNLAVEIAARGYRRSEPDGSQRETSQVLGKVLRSLRQEGVGWASVARELWLNPRDLDALVFGLVLLPVAGDGGSGERKSQANLRVVE